MKWISRWIPDFKNVKDEEEVAKITVISFIGIVILITVAAIIFWNWGGR